MKHVFLISLLGQHMYIPASETGCNTLNGNIGAASTATTSAFTIKVATYLDFLINCSWDSN